MQGLQVGTRPWLFAMRAYYTEDQDVVQLCLELEKAWDAIDNYKKGVTSDVKEFPSTQGIDDEWSAGG